MKDINELKTILSAIEALDKSSSMELVIVEKLNDLIDKYRKEKEKNEKSMQFHSWDAQSFTLTEGITKSIEIINDLKNFRDLLYKFLEINREEKIKNLKRKD